MNIYRQSLFQTFLVVVEDLNRKFVENKKS